MSKPEQVLIIDPPSELKFKGPFTTQVTSYMKLSNPTDRKVCFKIKTTAPKKYCVRPNSGVILPKKTVEVAVSLQPFDYEPNEKNKHKFMVMSMICPDGDPNLDTIWKDAPPEQLMDSKLKCVFEMPSENGGNEDPIVSEEITKKVTESKPPPKLNAEVVTKDSSAYESAILRKENQELRDELARLKQEMTLNAHTATSTLSVSSSIGAVGLQDVQTTLTTAHLVIAIVIAFAGILLGKFFL